MPSALGPGGHHHQLIRHADDMLEKERKRVAETRRFIDQVRQTQDVIEDFNANDRRRRPDVRGV